MTITSPHFRDLFTDVVMTYLNPDEKRVLSAVCKNFRERSFLHFFNQIFLGDTLKSATSTLTLMGAHRQLTNQSYTVQLCKNGIFADRFQAVCSHTLKKNKDPIHACVLTACRKYIVAGSSDKMIQVWDITTKKCVQTISRPPQESDLLTLAITADGRYIFSGSKIGSIRVYDQIKQKEVVPTALREHRGPIRAILLSPEKGLMISASEDGIIIFWHLGALAPISVLRGHPRALLALTLTANEQYLISGASDGAIRFLETETYHHTRSLQGHTGAIQTLVLTPDDKYLFSGSDDCTIRVWDCSDFTCLRTLKGHTKSVRTIALMTREKYIASGSDDSTVRIWNVITSLCTRILNGHKEAICSVALNGDSIISGSLDGTIRIWKNLYPLLEEILPPKMALEKIGRLTLLDIGEYLTMIAERKERPIKNLLPSAIQFTIERISRLPLKIRREIAAQLESREIYCDRLGCENFCGHHNDSSFDDRSSPILMQYEPPRDPQNPSHSENHQNSQNLSGHSISTKKKSSIQDSVAQFFTQIDCLPEETQSSFYEKIKRTNLDIKPRPFYQKQILYIALLAIGFATAIISQIAFFQQKETDSANIPALEMR